MQSNGVFGLPNPRREELWHVEDDLAREAGYDLDRIFDELRAAETRHPGPVIRSAEELQHHAAEQDRRRDAESTLVLKEEPPGIATLVKSQSKP